MMRYSDLDELIRSAAERATDCEAGIEWPESDDGAPVAGQPYASVPAAELQALIQAVRWAAAALGDTPDLPPFLARRVNGGAA